MSAAISAIPASLQLNVMKYNLSTKHNPALKRSLANVAWDYGPRPWTNSLPVAQQFAQALIILGRPLLYASTKVLSGSTEVLYKIRNGHPDAIMVSMRPFPIEVAVNVLVHAQTLPSR